MGGIGSGNWDQRPHRRTTAEESLVLPIGAFSSRINPIVTGSFVWDRQRFDGTITTSPPIFYTVAAGDRGPLITLTYWLRGGGEIELPVELQTTPTQFGGERWWFTCPLSTTGERASDDDSCHRRCAKLYLPPGAKYFGCRTCHRLTHRSSQEAHQRQRAIASMESMRKWIADTKKQQKHR